MNKYYFYILLSIAVLSACSTDDTASDISVPEIDLTWEDVVMPGASATVKPFECGDVVTRSSWEFNGQKMLFGWEKGDVVGLYPTAGNLTADKTIESYFVDPNTAEHPLFNEDIYLVQKDKSQAKRFFAHTTIKDSQTQQISPEDSEFEWDYNIRWTAYKPYNPNFNPQAQPPVYYSGLPIDFSNQTQKGLTDMQALYQGKGGYAKGYNNPYYVSTEIEACRHLSATDISLSPEMVWNDERINFQFQHVGAIARLFLLAPEKNLTLEKLELICDRKIFHVKGEVDLTSHVYNASEIHKGVRLVGDEDPIQMKYTDEASQKVTLNFPTDGSVKIKPPTSDNRYLNYLVAYVMMYPVDYQASRDGNLFVYVTAKDENDKEVHFVSEPLSDRNLKSGYYYQWTLRTHEDDGLYPIELTATLLPWQDIVGGGINTDLEK